jgi:hypothetical protein
VQGLDTALTGAKSLEEEKRVGMNKRNVSGSGSDYMETQDAELILAEDAAQRSARK